SEHPCHAAFEDNMHGVFEREIADLPPEPRPTPADRYPPLSTFRLGKGKEPQRAACGRNDDVAKNLGREERKPDNLHCERKGVVEQPHQDRKNETQDFVGGERDKNKWNDDHIVGGTAEAGPCWVTTIGHGATSGLKRGARRLRLAYCELKALGPGSARERPATGS